MLREQGDILLVEQVDRLYRLTAADWERLKAELTARDIRVVALDLPTSWMMATNAGDEFTGRMFEAIDGMLLDMLAAVARKDLRRSAPTAGSGAGEGKGRGALQGATGRLRAQRCDWANARRPTVWGEIQSVTG